MKKELKMLIAFLDPSPHHAPLLLSSWCLLPTLFQRKSTYYSKRYVIPQEIHTRVYVCTSRVRVRHLMYIKEKKHPQVNPNLDCCP